MKTKEINVIVKFRGIIPENCDIDEVQEQIEDRIDDFFRLHFDEGDEEYDEDVHEPIFERNSVDIFENGYILMG